MAYKLYDCVDTKGANLIKDWIGSQQAVQRAKLDEILDKLEREG